MKIYLVGMPGSGKSTLGKRLARELSVDFIDLDREIESACGTSITEIFRQHGEDHFRQIESRLLRQFASASQSFVMATGGGAPCFHNGMQVINETGISFYLDVPVDEIVRRVRKKKNRPLLALDSSEELAKKIQAMRDERHPCYRQANFTVANASLPAVLAKILPKM